MTPAFLDLIAKLIGKQYRLRFERHFVYHNYDFSVEMKQAAMDMVVKSWQSMNLEKSTNVLAFFTQVIVGGFLGYISKLRKKQTLESLSSVQ